MDYDVEIRKLSPAFYAAYPNSAYPEILEKEGRPYTCLLIDTHEDYLICVPFRSNMNHREGFRFKNTRRSARTRSGLDYKKIVLIRDSAYIDSGNPVVDSDEYRTVITNIAKIASKAAAYVEKYRNHVLGSSVLPLREFQRKYGTSTLPYFHDILGITP